MTVFVALFVLLKVIGEHEGTGSESNALNPKDEWLFSVRSLSLPPFPSPAFPSPFFLRSTSFSSTGHPRMDYFVF